MANFIWDTIGSVQLKQGAVIVHFLFLRDLKTFSVPYVWLSFNYYLVLMAEDKLTRIAIVNSDKCKPKKCKQECKKTCPVNRMGTSAIFIF